MTNITTTHGVMKLISLTTSSVRSTMIAIVIAATAFTLLLSLTALVLDNIP